jgi:lipopolysaccharide exporter
MSMKTRTIGLWKGDFLKNVSMIMSGTVIAQIVTLLTAPLLTRLYSAEALGIFSLYAAIVGVLSVAAAFRYELAIVLPRDEQEGDGLFLLSCLAVLATTVIVFVVVFAGGAAMTRRLGVPELERWLLWIPVTVLATGLYQNLNYWCTRHIRFKQMSISQVFRSVVVSLAQLAAGVFGFGSAGLIGGHFAGQSTAVTALGIQNGKELASRLRVKHGWRKLTELARQYAEFPKYSTPQALLNALSQNMPVFMLAIYYGAEIVAFYAISFRLMQLPVTLVSQSVRQVFLQQASAIRHDGTRSIAMFRKLTLTLAMIAGIPALVVMAFGPYIFEVVLGPEWQAAGQYARWMVLWLFFLFINPPAIVMSTVFGMQRMLLIFECLLLVFRFGALYIGGKYLSPMSCIALYSIVGAGFNTYLIMYVRRAVMRQVRIYAS